MKKLAVFLALLLLATMLFSCNDKDVSQSTGSTDSTSSSDESASSEYVKLDKYYENGVLRILGKKDGAHTYSKRQWLYNEELLGETINDAVDTRNRWLLENYGIEVQYTADTSGNYFINDTVQLLVDSGTDEYDVVCDSLTALSTLAQKGALYALDELEYLDLANDRWDQAVTEKLSILGKTYYAAGDILITDDDYTYCTLYNKDMFTEYDLGAICGESNMYDLVDNGGWTYDQMHQMTKQVAGEVDGDGTMTKYDRWGVVSDISSIYILMAGSNYSMSQLVDGEPQLSVQSDRAINLFTKASELLNDADVSLYSERIGGSSYYSDGEAIFGDGRSLFYIWKISAIYNFAADFTVNFGVLPIPKAEEDQSSYYNAAAYIHFSAVAIPITNGDNLELTCVALEALAALGKEYLTPAYIETTLKLKKLQDDNDSRMIDLIIGNRTFDLATIYDWGGLGSFFNKFAATGNTEMVSAWNAIASSTQAAMEETVEVFRKLGN
ncbi:MAG TPA: ABC transporter substrate-binding protein [Bacillota bacterium]|nr:ABC transporter substrate-binding protein [Bacillota bacterium]